MKLIFPFLLLLLVQNSQVGLAQGLKPRLIAAAGGSAKSAGFYLRWSLGEPITGTAKSAGYYFAKGFQQPVPSSAPTATRDVLNNATVEIFPNPTSSSFQLKIAARTFSEYLISFYSLDGKRLWNSRAEGDFIFKTFDIGHLPSGLYLLQVRDLCNNGFVVSKIQKNH